jgi:GNAT superfamily N-acetyltransferase
LSLTIRPAVREDAPVILELIRGLADYEKLSHHVVATEEMLEKWLFGERPMAEVVIADWEGSPRGFALFFSNFSTFLAKPGIFLEDLYVEPEFRGRGIGKALLLHLARTAVERGYGRVEWSVLDWNEPSIGFYKSLGAKPMDEWTNFRLTGEALARAGS